MDAVKIEALGGRRRAAQGLAREYSAESKPLGAGIRDTGEPNE